jgi:undecaprenyl-diphosphatase
VSAHLSFAEAIIVGAFQGVTELFPVSSLGHSVLVPALVGGRWAQDLNVSTPESPYLAFIVGLHVATAAALLVFFWRDWIRILAGFVSSLRYRRVQTAAERLAWLIVLATIPVGLSGLALEQLFRTTLGKPIPAAAFLMINGVALYAGEVLRRRAAPVAVPVTSSIPANDEPDERAHTAEAIDDRLAQIPIPRGVLIGSAQILALLPGISRSGITMVAGLWRGLSHEDAARFSFLLATPIILTAGVHKIPDLVGPLGAGIRGQVLAGSIGSFICAYLAVRYLTRYFQTRTLTPFAIYCTLAGAASLTWLATH